MPRDHRRRHPELERLERERVFGEGARLFRIAWLLEDVAVAHDPLEWDGGGRRQALTDAQR